MLNTGVDVVDLLKKKLDLEHSLRECTYDIMQYVLSDTSLHRFITVNWKGLNRYTGVDRNNERRTGNG